MRPIAKRDAAVLFADGKPVYHLQRHHSYPCQLHDWAAFNSSLTKFFDPSLPPESESYVKFTEARRLFINGCKLECWDRDDQEWTLYICERAEQITPALVYRVAPKPEEFGPSDMSWCLVFRRNDSNKHHLLRLVEIRPDGVVIGRRTVTYRQLAENYEYTNMSNDPSDESNWKPCYR